MEILYHLCSMFAICSFADCSLLRPGMSMLASAGRGGDPRQCRFLYCPLPVPGFMSSTRKRQIFRATSDANRLAAGPERAFSGSAIT